LEEPFSEAWTDVTPQQPISIINEEILVEDTSLDFLINTQSVSDVVSSEDFLTYSEEIDVEASLREIEQGEAEEFNNVEEFLRELNAE
jgi:hypothetical protein